MTNFKLVDPSAELDAIRRSLGAPLIDWSPESTKLSPRDEIRVKLAEGIELELDKVNTTAGLFEHEGEQVVIYIKDHTWLAKRQHYNFSRMLKQPDRCRRVHLMECRTIEDMKSQGRFERYVVTNRRDNQYSIAAMDDAGQQVEVDAPLRPCKNCLKALNYSMYNELSTLQKEEVFRSFDVEAYLESYSTFFSERPSQWADEVRPYDYVSEWSRTSFRIREAHHWVCQDCGVNLSDSAHRKYLHVHHKNGIKGDNSLSNLEVVCALCHQSKPMHGHMQVTENCRTVIVQQRRKMA